MKHNQLDKEYYVMGFDYANNYLMLAWGDFDYGSFLKATPIDINTLDLPIKIIFDETVSKECKMADFLMLGSECVGSNKLKNHFEQMNIYGIQFIPIEIKPKKGDTISGYFAINIWNVIQAIDKNNYEGVEPDEFGLIWDLEKFSLDTELLDKIPLEKRMFFGLAENNLIIVHQSIYEAIQKENLIGIKFHRIDEWDDSVMFR